MAFNVLYCLPAVQVIILSAAAEPALLDAVKLPPAAAGVGGGDDSAEPVVQLQRPSLFTNSKVRTHTL